MIKGILFDMDGTLVNTNAVIKNCFDYTTRKCLGKTFPVDLMIRYYGIPLQKVLETLFPGRGEEMTKIYRQHQLTVHDQLVREFPGMKDTLEQLSRQGIKMAVVTSKIDITARRALHCFQMEKYFAGIIGCTQVSRPKPDVEPSLKGLQLLGLSGSQCLCVGDSPFDLQSGKKAGCTTVAVNYSLVDPTVLRNEGRPDHIIDQPTELLALIQKLNAC